MMTDPNVEDCSCDGVDIPLFIFHRKYGSIKSNIRFEKELELDSYVVWLAQKCGKHISVADPLLDATIPDGSRLNATLGKHVTKSGSSFTIRRFKENPFTPIDLLKFKTMSTDMMAYLWISTEYGSLHAGLRRYRLRQDHDAQRRPAVHPAADEDRQHRGHPGAEPAP